MKMGWAAWVAAAIVCTGALPGGAQGGAQNRPELTGIAHIAFRASDLDREVSFFGKLGFEEAFSSVVNGHTLAVVIKVNDHQFIEVFPQTQPSEPIGLMRICYETPDMKALHDRYLAEGLRPTPVRPSPANNIIFSLLDTDSREVEFTQYLPGSRHMQDKGQHLGDRRVSDELLGFELPVTNLKAAQKFYEQLGFDAESDGAIVRLSLPANAQLRIELHSNRTSSQPQFLFPIDDARRTADELHKAGLKVIRDKKLVFVRDPDGNSFVLLETGAHSPRHLIPWHK